MMMQRTANENAACERRICKRSDQPKKKNVAPLSFLRSITLALLFAINTMIHRRFSSCRIEDGKIRKNKGKAEGFVNVDVLNSSSYLSH